MKLEAPATATRLASLPDHLAFIPQTWRVGRLRHAFNFNKGLTITKENLQDEGIPCVSYGEVHSKYGFEVDPDRHSLKCVDASYLKANQASLLKRGDFIFADTSEDIEGSGNFTCYNSDRRAFAGYHTLIAKPKVPMNYRFMAYVFDSAAFRVQVQTEVKGVKVFSISQGVLKPTFVWFPPRPEQDAIAAFLDEKCAKVDEAVRIKEEQIALLRERRQILIQEAVTRGLNPDAPMKDSGIDWVGPIPAHWAVVRLGACLRTVSARNRPDLPLLSITRELGVIKRDIDDQESNHNFIPDDLGNYKVLRAGQFGMNKMKAWQGSYGISPITGIVSPAYFTFDLAEGINPQFFNVAVRTRLYVSYFYQASDGVRIGQWDLSRERMKQIPFVVPSYDEQRRIVQFAAEQAEKINAAIAIKEQQVSALEEYRASLINAAVTGKIKVA